MASGGGGGGFLDDLGLQGLAQDLDDLTAQSGEQGIDDPHVQQHHEGDAAELAYGVGLAGQVHETLREKDGLPAGAHAAPWVEPKI
ncbi:MAG: hypothetical protein NVV74_23930 [Magnetospirillum sp.]|nr:hypothetical protein [Magnetospirillum sp.]